MAKADPDHDQTRYCVWGADILMTKQGPMVLDFDARFGGAETQVLLCLLDNSIDFAAALAAYAEGKLRNMRWIMKSGVNVMVVMCDQKYPKKSTSPVTVDIKA